MRRPPHYLDPAHRYTASFASAWRRLAAATIDWTLCFAAYIVVSIPLGAVQALGAVSWEERDLGGVPGHVVVIAAQVLTVAPAVAYFALLIPTSQTLGLRALDVHIVSLRTGRAPCHANAFFRAGLAVVTAVALYVVLQVKTTFQGVGHLDTASSYALNIAYVLAGAAAISALAMVFTRSHRSGLDRLLATAFIDRLIAISPVIGPWGNLDTFDLSNDRRAMRASS